MIRCCSFLIALFIPLMAQAQLFTELAETLFDVRPDFDGTEVVLIGTIQTSIARDDIELRVEMKGPPIAANMFKNESVGGIWMQTAEGRITIPSLLIHSHNIPNPNRGKLIQKFSQNISQPIPSDALEALVAQLQQRDQLRSLPAGIHWRSGTLFKTRLPIPSTAPMGTYSITTEAYHDGELLGTHQLTFELGRGGIERGLFLLANEHGWLYGLLGVVMAAFVGLGTAALANRR